MIVGALADICKSCPNLDANVGQVAKDTYAIYCSHLPNCKKRIESILRDIFKSDKDGGDNIETG